MEPWQKARGAGPRHPSGPLGFLHGRVRVPQDACPVVGAGLGSGRDRPRPGDERHAGIGNPRRAPRQDARHRQTGEGHGRQARPRGTRVRGGGAEPAACGRHHLRAHGQRLVRPHGVRHRRVRPQDRRLDARHHHGHQEAVAAGAGTDDIIGPPRMAARTVSCTVPAMARGASASCTPPGSGNSACLPRPARSAPRTTTPWPRAPTARTGPSSSDGASPSRI